MTREQTKKDLMAYLKTDKVSVVALKGLWGTGKTHLWDELKTELGPNAEGSPLYASCFGLASIEQVKLALVQNKLGGTEGVASRVHRNAAQIWGSIKEMTRKVGTPWLADAMGIAGSLGGLVQSAVIDGVLRNRLVVLDDIERSSPTLNVDTLMGFIDYLKRNHCQVLVILNEEPLLANTSGAIDWLSLKEKCVDREISLLITPDEAAAVALSADIPYRESALRAVRSLGVTNIRVVQRIDRVLCTLFARQPALDHDVSGTLVPAAVMLTALNFSAAPGAPDFSTLLDEWMDWCREPRYARSEELSPAVSFAATHSLTRDLDFITLVAQHLVTGHRLETEFDALLDDRQDLAVQSHFVQAARRFLDDAYMNPQMSDDDFVKLAQRHHDHWHLLSADLIDGIVQVLSECGAGPLANDLAERWAAWWVAHPRAWTSSLYSPKRFHPTIQAAIEQSDALAAPRPSLLESINAVSGEGWGDAHTSTINEAGVTEIVDVLRGLNREGFAQLLRFYSKEIQAPTTSNGEPFFSKGVATFLEAAKKVVADESGTRLAQLLRMHLAKPIKG